MFKIFSVLPEFRWSRGKGTFSKNENLLRMTVSTLPGTQRKFGIQRANLMVYVFYVNVLF